MNITTNQYSFAGFFSSSTIGFIHLGDLVMAVLLGFFGAAGAYMFKCLMDYREKKKK